MSNLTLCNHCVGKIVLSLGEHMVKSGLTFCCEQCSDGYFSPDNPEPHPIGLSYDLGVEE